MDEAALAGSGDGDARSDLPIESVRRLCCDGAIVPMVVLGDLIRDLGLGRLDDDAHRRRLQGTIADLRKHQNDDGGFGLWQESDSEGFMPGMTRGPSLDGQIAVQLTLAKIPIQ